MSTVLLTGATGTVGSAIARQLVERGDAVRALVRSPERARALLPAEVEAVEGDVTDAASVRRAVSGVRAVIHTAGLPEQWQRDPGIFQRVNAGGTRIVTEAALAEGVECFVHTSTIDVFDSTPGVEFDETRLDPDPRPTHYERSKQEADRAVVAAIERSLPARIVHPAAVYGVAPATTPGVNRFLERLAHGGIPALLPGGMPLVDSDDVAAGHLLAMKAPVGSRFILSESWRSLAEIARAVVELRGKGRVPPVLPVFTGHLLAGVGETVSRLTRRPPLVAHGELHFLLAHMVPSSRRAREELGWTAVPFREGLRRTLEDMERRGCI